MSVLIYCQYTALRNHRVLHRLIQELQTKHVSYSQNDNAQYTLKITVGMIKLLMLLYYCSLDCEA